MFSKENQLVAKCFSLHKVDVVSMGVHFRIARGARVSWFPSNDLAYTSSLHFIHSIYRRWVVYRSVARPGRNPALATRRGLPRTGASVYSASSATHLVSSEMGFSIFPLGLNRSFSRLVLPGRIEYFCIHFYKILIGFGRVRGRS